MTRLSNHSSGFTLIELAMVLFIVSLLIGSMMMPLSAQYEIRGRQETDKALANIREALIGFAVVNGRLPCPAPTTLATGATGVGLEATTAAAGTVSTTGPCGCTVATSGIASAGGTACDDSTPGDVTGVLPWATLGLPETDAWNNRYTYRMTTRFGRLASGQSTFGCFPTSNPTNAAFALCSVGNISVLTSTVATGGTAIASAIPAIVVSHGKNGAGAFNATGGTNPASLDPNERENTDGDNVFVSKTPNPNYDDLVIWISPNILFNRMVAAGKLP